MFWGILNCDSTHKLVGPLNISMYHILALMITIDWCSQLCTTYTVTVHYSAVHLQKFYYKLMATCAVRSLGSTGEHLLEQLVGG